jgi:hypothetical protein
MKHFFIFLFLLAAIAPVSADTPCTSGKKTFLLLGDTVIQNGIVFSRNIESTRLPDSLVYPSKGKKIKDEEATTALKECGKVVCSKKSYKTVRGGFLLLTKKIETFLDGIVCQKETDDNAKNASIARLSRESQKLDETAPELDLVLLVAVLFSLIALVLAYLCFSSPSPNHPVLQDKKIEKEKIKITNIFIFSNCFFVVILFMAATFSIFISFGLFSFPLPGKIVFALATLNLGAILGFSFLSMSFLGLSANKITPWLIFMSLLQFIAFYGLITKNPLYTLLYFLSIAVSISGICIVAETWKNTKIAKLSRKKTTTP